MNVLMRSVTILTLAVAVAVGCLGIPSVTAQSPGSGTLLVLSKADRTLSLVDPITLKVLAAVPSGPDPHEVTVSTDGRTAYISNYNPASSTITVVDLASRKVLAPVDLGPLRAPHGLAFAAGKLWFTAEASKAVGSYDPASGKVDWVLGTGQNRTHMIFTAADGRWLVTSNVSSATLTFIEKTAEGGRSGPGARGGPPAEPAARGRGPRGRGGQGDWDATVIPVGRGAEGFDVSPDGKELWAANAQDGTISIIDIASKRVTDTLAASVTGANRLKFTPDGKMVFVSTLGGADLTIIDAATRKDVKRLPVGRAAGILMQPDGSRAYVACTPDDHVEIIDLKTLAPAGRIEAGRQPDGLAWTTVR
jgi:YVTN family beta-propeller protein